MKNRIPVVILGATGLVGQRFVQLLDAHPWFEVAALTGSERTVGKSYGKICPWVLDTPVPAWASRMVLVPSELPALPDARLAFSALPSEIALTLEPQLARAGLAVCSNASAFRNEPDVPLLLPEVNPEHLFLVHYQRQRRGWEGCIVANPNCTSTGLTVALKALQTVFGVERVFLTSFQALSGAGYPGVPSLEILDNVIPFIEGEEEKVEWEPRKMLGEMQGSKVTLSPVSISAHTNRVPVRDGHLVCASVELSRPAEPLEVSETLRGYQAPEAGRDLPSAPLPPIVVLDEPDRPQPRRDGMTGNGMTTVVGRIRRDPIFHIKFAVLSHNTIRGAAGGSIYNAELLVKQEMLK